MLDYKDTVWRHAVSFFEDCESARHVAIWYHSYKKLRLNCEVNDKNLKVCYDNFNKKFNTNLTLQKIRRRVIWKTS